MAMYQRSFKDTPSTLTDDRAYLLETRSIALLRVAPIILIMLGLLTGVLSLWLDPSDDRLIRLAEMVIAGALGSLTTVFSQSPPHGSDDSRIDPNLVDDIRP